MVWEAVWKPFDVEKMIKEMNLLWDSVFFTRVLNTSRSINIVKTKKTIVKKSGISKVIKVE